MPTDPTARLRIQACAGSDPLNQIDEILQAAFNTLDAEAAIAGWGTFASIPAAGVKGRFYLAEDLPALFYDTGSGWTRVRPGVRVASLPAVGPSGAGPLVDGQECYFVADDAHDVVWHLRYNATSSHWEFLGGADLQAAGVSGTGYNFQGGDVWRVIPSPAITLPLSGTYDFDAEASIYPTSGVAQLEAFGAGKQGGSGPYGGMNFPGAATFQSQAYGHLNVQQRGSGTAGDVVSWGAGFGQAVTVNFASVAVRVRPVALTG